ncbi:hypothetical protein FRC01_007101, partial [Tulasnella sp. 417]
QTHIINITQGKITESVIDPGFTALTLVDEIAINVILIGLGQSEEVQHLKHTIIHTGLQSLTDVLNALQKADTLHKSDEMSMTNSSALAARQPQRPTPTSKDKGKYYCSVHGKNKSHNSKDCKKLQGKEEGARVTNEEGKEGALAAGVRQISNPPTLRNRNARADSFWNADSGATSHMTPHKEWIRNMEPCHIPIHLANNQVVYATGKGKVVFTPSKNLQSVMFSKVLYVPSLQNNLFSIVSAVLDAKLRVEIEGRDLVFKRGDNVILTGTINGKVAMLDGITLGRTEKAFVVSIRKDLLHNRLAHIGRARLERMLKQDLVKGIVVEGGSDIPDTCEHCIAGKQHRDPFPKLASNRATEVLERIHTDVHGPLPQTVSGFKYWIVFVDDASRHKDAVPMKKKSEASDAIKAYIRTAEKQTGKKVKIIRDDKGGEYMSKELQQFLDERGIIREKTVRATPSQNGVAERLNRTLAEGIVAMLHQANLPQSFWSQALLYLINIQNVTPSSALSETTSYAVWHGRKPDLTMYRTFGCRIFVNVARKDRKNLESHTKKGIFIGFEKGMKGWKYCTGALELGVTIDAIFDENTFPGLSKKGTDSPTPLHIRSFWDDSGFDEDDPATSTPPAPPPPPSSPATTAAPSVPPPATYKPLRPATPPTPEVKSEPESPIQLPFPRPAPESPAQAGPSTPRERRIALGPVPSPSFADVLQFPPLPPADPPKAKKVLAPPRGDRPIRSVTKKTTDYYDGTGKRKGTQPAPRRVEEVDDRDTDVVIGRGGVREQPRQEMQQVLDRGGTQNPPDSPERPPPGAFPTTNQFSALDISPDSEEEADVENAVKVTPIVDSLEYVYGVSNDFIPCDLAQKIGFEIAREKALSVATRPEDSPRNWREAMSRPDADKWMEAAEAEVEALRSNGTWDLVQLPEGRKAIGSRWVFLVKRKSDGSIERYKARLVAKGYAQAPGIDFDQVFAPTARLAALRAILAQAALSGEHIESLDISNAYLNGELEKEYEVYMQQPEGFTEHGSKGQKWVCRLRKGLYGLKQAGRLWYQKLGETLEKIGFKQINADPSVYVWQSDNVRVILPVFVDDVTVVSKDQERVKWVKSEISKHFKIKDLGPTSYLLGIKIDYDREKRRLQLSQRQYIIDMLNRFDMPNCTPVTTPMDPGSKLTRDQAPKSDEDVAEMASKPYMNAVGALMYLAVATRPDIAFSVAKLAQFNSNPGVPHWKAVKHLFRYLKGTMDLKLTYQPIEGESQLSSEIFRAYSDADHAGCLDTRKSTTGYFLKMGTGAISWSSKKQTSVAWSSTEAEYIAASTAGQEVVWMRGLLKELGFKVEGPSPLIMDNQSAISVVKNPEHHGRMKHVDIRHHWIRQEVRRKNLSVHFIPTEQMTSDILTKPLTKPWVEQHRIGLGL